MKKMSNTTLASLEVAALIQRFQSRFEMLMQAFEAEATALGWKLVAESMSADNLFDGLHIDAAVSGKKTKKAYLHAPDAAHLLPISRPVLALPPPPSAEVKKKYRITDSARNRVAEKLMTANLCWQPKNQSKNKYTYKCIGESDSSKGIYLMENETNKKVSRVRLESVVTGWRCYPKSEKKK